LRRADHLDTIGSIRFARQALLSGDERSGGRGEPDRLCAGVPRCPRRGPAQRAACRRDGGPEEVWAALRELGGERTGHGIGAAAGPALLACLAERRIALKACPTSNVRTGTVPSLREHPLPALLDAGVPVTLATDDPGMFHANLNNEYLLCHHQFGLGPGELADTARAGARAAFCPEPARTAVLAEIDRLTIAG
jgi:adenosine deaminase